MRMPFEIAFQRKATPKESNVKRALALCFLVIFSAQFSLADSVKIFNNISAFLQIFPNDGSGGNMVLNFSGPISEGRRRNWLRMVLCGKHLRSW
jgi:hypothetical protein